MNRSRKFVHWIFTKEDLLGRSSLVYQLISLLTKPLANERSVSDHNPINRLFQFEVFGKTSLGKINFTPPFKVNTNMEDEARFVHVIMRTTRLYYPNGHMEFSAGDSFIMKKEIFVSNWVENEDGSANEAIVFQIYPEVLREIYKGILPKALTPSLKPHKTAIQKIESSVLLTEYFKNLKTYFDCTNLIDEELISINIVELIKILISTDPTGDVQAMLKSLFAPQEYELAEIVNAHLYDDLKIEDLAYMSGLSLSSFKRKFASIYQTSPAQ